MITLHNGFAYMIRYGRIWITDTTQVTLSEWFNAKRDPHAILWRSGDIKTGFAV